MRSTSRDWFCRRKGVVGHEIRLYEVSSGCTAHSPSNIDEVSDFRSCGEIEVEHSLSLLKRHFHTAVIQKR